MRKIPPLLSVLLALAAILAACSREVPTDPQYVAEIDWWHGQRLENLRSETGWLTLVGLYELHEGIHLLGSAPEADLLLPDKAPAKVGQLEVGTLGLVFAAEPDAGVTLFATEDSAPVTKVLLESDRSGEPTRLACGTLVFYLIDRQGRLFMRVKDTAAPLLEHFAGIERFPVKAKWRVPARLEGPAGQLQVPSVLGQESAEPTPGTLVFELDGKRCRLTPTGLAGEPLFVVFGDQTNGQTTYGGGRFLAVDPPDPDGRYHIDFNKAYNPPCVFTPYATCPLPPPQNRLPLEVTAGEMMWGAQH